MSITSMRTFASGFWILLGLAALGGGCGGTSGEPGQVNVMYQADNSVGSVNLTGLGLPHSPSEFVAYPATQTSANISWNTGVTYYAKISVPEDEGEDLECEYDLYIIPKKCKDGDDGKDRTYLLRFSGDTVSISILNKVYKGEIF